MNYKFAHFADVHWRGLTRHSEYRRSFEDAFKTMKAEKIDGTFIVGDIVHSKTQGISPELIDCLCWWFRKMSEIAPVYITLGNHDGLIMNKDREDAISPIIRALGLPNIHLIKNSENFSIDENIELCNFSCFDEESWSSVKPVENKVNIALFHGAVKGSETDIEWEMEGEVDSSFFKGFDFAFLGDIHKYQYIDKERRIAYCGSTIQQNFGETPDKGFMIWEIRGKDDYSSRHVRVAHNKPYVTIDWKGNVSETLDEADVHPDNARFRIRTNVAISQGEIKQLYSALKEFKNATEIVMKHDVPKNDLMLEQKLQGSRVNLRDPSTVAAMVRSYYERAGLNEKMYQSLEDLVHKFWKSASKIDTCAGSKWSIKSLSFDNTFGYGKNNLIDFNAIDGITGIFGKNRIGKSSVCGTLMYVLFNTTDRGAMSNLHVINSRKGHCRASAIISKRGKNYKIERQTVKKESRSGKLSVTTHLNLFEIDANGDVMRDLCGEQRRETEKTLRDIIGLPEDFLLTAFASQGEMNTFLKQKGSSRKTVLSKFLELDVFDHLYEIARSESAGVKQLIRNAPDRDFDVTLIDTKNKLKSKQKEREKTFKCLEETRDKTRQLELTLATNPDRDLVTCQDVDEQISRVQQLTDRREMQKKTLGGLGDQLKEASQKVLKIQEFKESFPAEDLKISLEEQRDLENATSSIRHRVDKERQKLKALETQVDVLKKVPCGDKFPTCAFILNANKAKNSLGRRYKKLEELSEDLKITRSALKKLQSRDLEEKLEKYNSLIQNLNTLNIKKGKFQIDEVDLKNNLEKTVEELKYQEQALDEMRMNVASNDAAEQLRSLRVKLRRLKTQETGLEERYQLLSEEVGLLQSSIINLQKDKEEYDALLEQWRVFELFLQATSKNGIPLEIIRSRLPEINIEIASILQGVTGFTVELESDEGSNEMNIYINYGDSRRIIECCSGMEKMMSAMAIRVALTNVSELSKPDIFVIDEGFGSLDAGNIEACTSFLESLKKWFRCILIISHVDAVKDAVDNILEIEKRGNDAYVQQK